MFEFNIHQWHDSHPFGHRVVVGVLGRKMIERYLLSGESIPPLDFRLNGMHEVSVNPEGNRKFLSDRIFHAALDEEQCGASFDLSALSQFFGVRAIMRHLT